MVARRDDRHDLGFPAAFLGLLIAPGETTETLLTMPKPRFGVMILLTLLLTIFIPVLIQYSNYREHLYHPQALVSLLVVVMGTLVIFSVLENVFLRIIGIRVPLGRLSATICYCMAPVIAIVWAMYFMNFVAHGNLSFLTIMLNSDATERGDLVKLVPWAIYLGLLLSFIVFFYSIKHLGNLFVANAAIIAVLSFIPFYTSFIMAVLAGELIHPGTLKVFLQFFIAPTSILQV